MIYDDLWETMMIYDSLLVMIYDAFAIENNDNPQLC